MELSIDTSTRFASVALTDHGNPVAETSWHSRQNHTVELAPAVQRLLQQVGKAPHDLTALFVALGPGGFSALRVGLGFAKGMAQGLNVPLVAISTLEVEAYPYASTGLPVYPLIDTGRGQVAWAAYHASPEWQQREDARVSTLDELVENALSFALFCGEALPTHLAFLQEKMPEAHYISIAPPTRRAFTLAQLGWKRFEKGEHDDPAPLQPLYLRRPSISLPKAQKA